ncbi:MAG: AAA family ATPase [Acetobacteraceae bacterium]
MPDGTMSQGRAVTGIDASPVRHDRLNLIGFVADAETEAALQAGLAALLPEAPDFRRGNIRTAQAAMQKIATPRILIVDISGEDQPLKALGDLAAVVEPDVCVLVVGEHDSTDFYREVTRGLGAADYLAKPLTRENVARHFGSLVMGRAPSTDAVLGGRVLTVTGVRGGTGASTVAANLAWHLGANLRHHTVLFDPDLYRGTAAFLFNLQPGAGLRTALEYPDRIDSLLAERAAVPAADRVHVLSGEEPLGMPLAYASGAGERLVEALRRRYNFVIADVPFAPVPLHRDLLDLAHQRILVLEPTLAAMRDTLRLLGLPAGPNQTQGAVLVLNRLGLPGGLSRRQIEDGLKTKIDIVIPDMPKPLRQAANLGEPAIVTSTALARLIGDLARQVAALALVDAAATDAAAPRRRVRRPLFSWPRRKAA